MRAAGLEREGQHKALKAVSGNLTSVPKPGLPVNFLASVGQHLFAKYVAVVKY